MRARNGKGANCFFDSLLTITLWQANCEDRAGGTCTIQLQAAAMTSDKFLTDRQPQSCAAFACSALKGLEQVCLRFLRQTRAGIAHFHPPRFVILIGGHTDFTGLTACDNGLTCIACLLYTSDAADE